MQRREFLKWATHGLGVLFGTVLGIPAIAYLLDARNRPAKAGEFKRVARLSDLTVNEPHQVALHDVRRDAWTLHPNDVLGRVWLIRRDEKNVDAYTTSCPHLGCSINYIKEANRFICPCHNGTFHLTCERVSEQELGASNPAPRGMDSLELNLVEAPPLPDGKPDFFVEVKYQNFKQGEAEKLPRS